MRNAKPVHNACPGSGAMDEPQGAVRTGVSFVTGSRVFLELRWADTLGAGLADACDLSVLARELAPGESLSVEFSRSERSSPGRVCLEIASAALTPSDGGRHSLRPSASAIVSVLNAAFPGCIAVRTEAPAAPWRGHVIDLPFRRLTQGFSDPDCSSQNGSIGVSAPTFEAGVGILLPGEAGPRIDLPARLGLLLASAHPFALRLTLQSMALSRADRAQVALAASRVRVDAEVLMRDPAGFRQQLRDRQLLSGWSRGGTGWRVEWSLDLPGSLGDRLLFARALAPEDAVGLDEVSGEGGVLDLSSALPREAGLRHLLPSIGELRALGFLQAPAPSGPVTRKGDDVLTLGRDLAGTAICVPRSDLGRHMLVLGATGTGKSCLVAQTVLQDIEAGLAGIVLDPHGDLVRDIYGALSPRQRARVDLIDLARDPGGLGLDLLGSDEADPALAASRAANDLAEVFQRVMFADNPESMGPIFLAYFRSAMMLMMLAANATGRPARLSDFDRVFHDAPFRRELLSVCPDPSVSRFWTGIAVRAGGEASLDNLGPYLVSKMNGLTANPRLRPIVDGEGPKLDLNRAFDGGRMLLINLGRGSFGASDAGLIGALVTARVLRDLMARCARPRDARPPVRVVIDEFQTIATMSLAQLMAEGRKSGAQILCCSQDLTSFGGSRLQPQVAGAILSNIAHLVAFRLGPRDAALVADWFAPDLGAADLMRLPDRSFAARLLAHGQPQLHRFARTMPMT